MGIVTRRGDKGKTSLFFGGVVAKDHLRVELNGALDELSSFLGMAKSLIKNKTLRRDLESVQKDLVVMGAEVATAVKFIPKLRARLSHIQVRRLEKRIRDLEAREKRKNFCLSIPGRGFVSGCLDVCRTIARRAERRAVSLSKKKKLQNKEILIYLNRVSDMLYLLARKTEDS